MNRLLKITLISGVIGLVLSCSESKFVEPEEPTFLVSGTIYSVYCGLQFSETPYHEISDYPATIRFTNLDRDIFTEASTNSESQYSLSLPTGSYLVETYSNHWQLQGYETLNLQTDTLLNQVGVVEWLWADTIVIDFYYETGDTLAVDSEMVLIQKLDAAVGGYLYPESSTRFQHPRYGGALVWNEYHVPFDPGYHPYLLSGDLNDILDTDTLNFPNSMWAHLRSYICLHGREKP